MTDIIKFFTIALSLTLASAPYALAAGSQVIITQTVTGTTTSTTTPSPTPAPTPTPAPGGSGIVGSTPAPITFTELPSEISPPLLVRNIIVGALHDTAAISWQTNIPSIGLISWGRTAQYADGNAIEVSFKTDHTVLLTNLIPDTTYLFSIAAQDERGGTAKIDGRMFTTLPLPDTTPPAPPRAVTSISGASTIRLTWDNPIDADFSATRVIRSEEEYILDPRGARVVYDGRGESVIDTDVAVGTVYYYTFFARDTAGNYSSGVTVLGSIPDTATITQEDVQTESLSSTSSETILEQTTQTLQENIQIIAEAVESVWQRFIRAVKSLFGF